MRLLDHLRPILARTQKSRIIHYPRKSIVGAIDVGTFGVVRVLRLATEYYLGT